MKRIFNWSFKALFRFLIDKEARFASDKDPKDFYARVGKPQRLSFPTPTQKVRAFTDLY